MNSNAAQVGRRDHLQDAVVAEIVATGRPTSNLSNLPLSPHKRTYVRRTEVMRRMREACCPSVAVFLPPAPACPFRPSGGLR